jgi:hypothetical protein
VLGAGLSLLMVMWHRRHPPEAGHMPSVAPIMEPVANRPSVQAR